MSSFFGGATARTAWAAWAVWAAASLVGCANDPGAGNDPGQSTSPVALGKELESLAHVQLDVPAEWTKKTTGAWLAYTSPDGISRLAVGALQPEDTIAKKLAEAGSALGASSVTMMEEQPTRFGPEQLPARAADGACKLGSGEGRIGYVVVDLGDGKRVLLVHAAPQDTPDENLATGRRVIASLKRR
jgi:hypothetical protein